MAIGPSDVQREIKQAGLAQPQLPGKATEVARDALDNNKKMKKNGRLTNYFHFPSYSFEAVISHSQSPKPGRYLPV